MTRWFKPWELHGSDTRTERRSLREALELFHTAIRGRPSELAAPAVSTFPGRKVPVVPGQLELDRQALERDLDGEAQSHPP